MKHRYFKTVAIILVLVILAGSYYYFANWPPFPDYQEEFDYTVSGVKYRTEAYCKESAF